MKACILLLNLLVLIIPHSLFGQTPSVSIGKKPDWVVNPSVSNARPPFREINKGYFLRQLEYQVHVDKQATYVRVIREIVSEAGVQNGSEISISFDPVYEKLEINVIKVWRKNQALNRLDIKKFKMIADEEDLSRFIYQGTYSAFLILDDIRKGDRIEFSYTVTGRNPIFANKFSTFFRLQEYTPVLHNYNCLLSSAGRKLNFKYLNNAPKAKVSINGGTVKHEWESFNQKALQYEDETPEWFSITPLVQVSEFKSWAEVAKWADRVNPASVNLSGSLNAFVAQLKIRHQNDNAGLFRAAVQFVQDEVRYMGVETGEYSHRANKPEKVFAQRYGDCKDKSLLLVSILRAAGIFDANMALLNTNEKGRVVDYLPSPTLFDHAVVCATVNGKKVWIDPTISYQGGTGANIYFPDYKKALIVNDATTNLTDITPGKQGKTIYSDHFTVFNYASDVEYVVKSTYTLDDADYMRSSLASKSVADLEKEYLKYYAETYPKIKSADTLIVQDNRIKNELTVIEKYTIPDFFQKDSVTGTYNTDFYSGYVNNLFPKLSAERKQPLSISAASIEHTIEVIMPSGWSIDDIDKEVNNKVFDFRYTVSSIDNTLTLHYEIDRHAGFIPAEEYKNFALQVKNIKDNYLNYSINHIPEATAFYPNYGLITFSVLLLLALVWLGYVTYFKASWGSPEGQPIKLGGWLILIMISLASAVYHQIYDIIDLKLLDLNTWEFYSFRKSSTLYKVFLCMRMFSALYITGYATFCLLLMLKKRDILPKTITVYLASTAILVTINHILSTRLYGDDHSSFSNVMYSIISSFIGIYYFKTAERVKDTFVVGAGREVQKKRVFDEIEEEA